MQNGKADGGKPVVLLSVTLLPGLQPLLHAVFCGLFCARHSRDSAGCFC